MCETNHNYIKKKSRDGRNIYIYCIYKNLKLDVECEARSMSCNYILGVYNIRLSNMSLRILLHPHTS